MLIRVALIARLIYSNGTLIQIYVFPLVAIAEFSQRVLFQPPTPQYLHLFIHSIGVFPDVYRDAYTIPMFIGRYIC